MCKKGSEFVEGYGRIHPQNLGTIDKMYWES